VRLIQISIVENNFSIRAPLAVEEISVDTVIF